MEQRPQAPQSAMPAAERYGHPERTQPAGPRPQATVPPAASRAPTQPAAPVRRDDRRRGMEWAGAVPVGRRRDGEPGATSPPRGCALRSNARIQAVRCESAARTTNTRPSGPTTGSDATPSIVTGQPARAPARPKAAIFVFVLVPDPVDRTANAVPAAPSARPHQSAPAGSGNRLPTATPGSGRDAHEPKGLVPVPALQEDEKPAPDDPGLIAGVREVVVVREARSGRRRHVHRPTGQVSTTSGEGERADGLRAVVTDEPSRAVAGDGADPAVGPAGERHGPAGKEETPGVEPGDAGARAAPHRDEQAAVGPRGHPDVVRGLG